MPTNLLRIWNRTKVESYIDHAESKCSLKQVVLGRTRHEESLATANHQDRSFHMPGASTRNLAIASSGSGSGSDVASGNSVQGQDYQE